MAISDPVNRQGQGCPPASSRYKLQGVLASPWNTIQVFCPILDPFRPTVGCQDITINLSKFGLGAVVSEVRCFSWLCCRTCVKGYGVPESLDQNFWLGAVLLESLSRVGTWNVLVQVCQSQSHPHNFLTALQLCSVLGEHGKVTNSLDRTNPLSLNQ